MEGRFRKFGDQDRRKGPDQRAGQERRSSGGDEHNQSVFDWLEREQEEERRSIPFSVAPRGEVRTEDGSHWQCTLWDVSQRGLCVVANGCFELPLGSELSISLFEVVGLGSAAFKANLRWFASDEFQTYLGLQFREPSTLPPDTFLERYLQTDFNV